MSAVHNEKYDKKYNSFQNECSNTFKCQKAAFIFVESLLFFHVNREKVTVIDKKVCIVCFSRLLINKC